MSRAVFGIDLGGTKTAIGRLGADGAVAEIARFATGAPEETLARVEEAIAAARPGPDPLLGVACGGPLDAAAGLVLSPPNLPGWDRVPVVARLEARFGGRARLMNDANANALAEWRWGAGRGCRSMVFLTAGTGMGAGLILDGRLYEGANGNAGEVGHVRLAPDGPVGYGKPGSFEGFCSGGGIARLAALRAAAAGRTLPPGTDAAALAGWARRGDALAASVWTEAGTRLGEALALLIDVLNPERIVLGSLYVRARDLLEPPLRAALVREALPGAAAVCEIVPAGLGEALGVHGAVAAALHEPG